MGSMSGGWVGGLVDEMECYDLVLGLRGLIVRLCLMGGLIG